MKIYKLAIVAIVMIVSANSAEVSGQGFVKTKQGQVVTCAGEKVYLVIDPACEMIFPPLGLLNAELSFEVAMHGFNKQSGQPVSYEKWKKIHNDISAKKSLLNKYVDEGKVLTTVCNAQGKFEFKNVNNINIVLIVGTIIHWKDGLEKKNIPLSEIIKLESKDAKINVLLSGVDD